MSLNRRAQIARASWECVQQLGFQAASIAEIARRVECTPRTFWNHFADREEAVLEAVLPDGLTAQLFPPVACEGSPWSANGVLLDRWEHAAVAAGRSGALRPLQQLGALTTRDKSLAPVVTRSWAKLIRAAHHSVTESTNQRDLIVGTAAAAALGTVITGPIGRGPTLEKTAPPLHERISRCFAVLRETSD